MNMYFIAIVAPAEKDKEIQKWKFFMKERFDCSVSLKSPAHITLIPPFWMKPEFEFNLTRSIDNFCQQQNPFIIHLKNFAAFKPRVIFAEVLKNELLYNMKENFENFITGLNQFPIKKDARSFHPHVTIATRDLRKRDFFRAWEVFEKKEFESDWQVNSISLLRNDQKKWEVIFTSHFIR